MGFGIGRIWIGIVTAGVLAAHSAFAQEGSATDLKKEIQALTEAVKGMQKDLQDIKAVLPKGQPAPQQTVTLELGNNPAKGEGAAKVTLVEFTDYQCSFCARHFRDTLPQIEKEYIATGKIKYVLMDLPLEQIHPLALKGAEAANCAGEQGKYWEMHDRLFSNPQTLDAWSSHAQAVGLNVAQFEGCLGDGTQAAEVRSDATQARAAGISGTPGFALGFTDANSSKLTVVGVFTGAHPFASFKAQIDPLIEQAQTR